MQGKRLAELTYHFLKAVKCDTIRTLPKEDGTMKNETILKEDFEFEYAKAKATHVEARQGDLKIFVGKITGYSTDHVAIEGKKLLRDANEFYVIE
jgi:hypothetical protein